MLIEAKKIYSNQLELIKDKMKEELDILKFFPILYFFSPSIKKIILLKEYNKKVGNKLFVIKLF